MDICLEYDHCREYKLRYYFAYWFLPVLYGLLYAPWGINTSDGGFISGLGWQVASGKTMYADIAYVRPPVPVLWRAFEIYCLPVKGAILVERWLFYFKMATISCWAVRVLYPQPELLFRRTVLSAFAFLLAVHNYPAAAWHTVDGLLFATLALLYFFRGKYRWHWVLAGIAMAAAMLCKQSFYPMAGIFALALMPQYRYRSVWLLTGWGSSLALFAAYLNVNDLTAQYLALTTGTATGAQAIEHGIYDYFDIHPFVAIATLVMLLGWFKFDRWRLNIISAWLLFLMLSFAWTVWQRQAFTVPFAASRALFWVALASIVMDWRENKQFPAIRVCLTALAWCASISWGYNTPILYSAPLMLGVHWFWNRSPMTTHIENRWILLGFIGLVLLFGIGYQFVYRDGPRAEMTESLGPIFPALAGIHSTPATAEKLRDFKQLAGRYADNYIVLPVFTQAHFLTQTASPLPLDWVAWREMGPHGEAMVLDALNRRHPYILVEKSALAQIDADPELRLVKSIINQAKPVEETAWYRVLSW